MRLADLLFRASLLAAPACCNDDGTTKMIHATRAEHAAAIDRCLANDQDCLRVCSEVLDLPYDYSVYECTVLAQTADGVDLEAKYAKDDDCAMGRRPCGYHAIRDGARTAGAWLARAANLEAASVVAFARLARDLVRIGAPLPLIDAAKRALVDELHHAALVGALARAFGAEPAVPRVADTHEPSVFELACDNAVAGQVGETHAALVALCQGRLATDPRIAAAFTAIAADEARHAELAHVLAAFYDTRLTADERRRVDVLRRAAIAALRSDFLLDAPARALLGIPAAPALAAATAALFDA